MKIVERLTNTEAMTMLAFTLYDHDADEDYYNFYGRWAGEDVRLVGDYDESGLYDEPNPTLEIAPLSNPHLIKEDKSTTTAPDPESVTEDWTVELDYARHPILKGSWNHPRYESSMPSSEHPDSDLTEGTYMKLRTDDDDRLDEDTFGVVMDIENDWTDITDGVEKEYRALVDQEDIVQDGTALMPKRVLSMD